MPRLSRMADLARRTLGDRARREQELDEMRRAIGHLHTVLTRRSDLPSTIHDVEFKVFSQWGEDGIIQFLVNAIPIAEEVFVEIGVDDYRESNTRFLAMNDNWRGLIIDTGVAHQSFLTSTSFGWRWTVDALSEFVTAENVDDLLTSAGICGDIGLLSIDIDGMDYWIWRAITGISPRIVVVEFNSIFGPELAVTVPYEPEFDVHRAHPSGQYFGASLAALHSLALSKGYQLVGVGRNGVNAFFVRRDVAGGLWDLSPQDAYVRTRVRTSRDEDGHLTYVGDHRALLRGIRDKALICVEDGGRRRVNDLYEV